MSEYTPGPWIYDAGAFYAKCQLNERGMTRESPIAEMLNGREDDYEANARLIAAAPELLEACELALKVLEQSGMITRQLLDADRKLRAAIAKAKGEQ